MKEYLVDTDPRSIDGQLALFEGPNVHHMYDLSDVELPEGAEEYTGPSIQDADPEAVLVALRNVQADKVER